MKKDSEYKDLEQEIEIGAVEEKPKALTPQQLIHQSKAPIFANANKFKGGIGNNFNSRQRPGRAAGRGR